MMMLFFNVLSSYKKLSLLFHTLDFKFYFGLHITKIVGILFQIDLSLQHAKRTYRVCTHSHWRTDSNGLFSSNILLPDRSRKGYNKWLALLVVLFLLTTIVFVSLYAVEKGKGTTTTTGPTVPTTTGPTGPTTTTGTGSTTTGSTGPTTTTGTGPPGTVFHRILSHHSERNVFVFFFLS